MTKPPSIRRSPQSPPRFHIKVLGFDVSAEGNSGIYVACFLVIFIIAAWRWF